MASSTLDTHTTLRILLYYLIPYYQREILVALSYPSPEYVLVNTDGCALPLKNMTVFQQKSAGDIPPGPVSGAMDTWHPTVGDAPDNSCSTFP